MAVKGTTFYGWGEYGFSESWYSDSKDAKSMITSLKNIQGTRMFLMGDGWRILEHVIADVDAPNAGDRELVNLQMDFPSSLSDNPNTVLACYFLSGRYRRNFYLRALPDKYLVWDQAKAEFTFTPECQQYFWNFREKVKTEKLGFRAVDTEGALGKGFPVDTWNTQNNRLVANVPGVPGEVKAGTPVLFREVTGATAAERSLLNGRVINVAKRDGVEFELDTSAALFPNFDDLGGGRMYPRVKKTVVIDDGEIIGVTAKKIGKVRVTWKGRRYKNPLL